jgi:hypothetical protein
MTFVLYWILNGVIGVMSLIIFEAWKNNINIPNHAWNKINVLGFGVAAILGPIASISAAASIINYIVE